MNRQVIAIAAACITFGLFVAVLGTYGSVSTAQSRAERRSMILWAIALSLGIGLFCGGMFLVSEPYCWLLRGLYPICLVLAISACNRSLAKVRADQRQL